MARLDISAAPPIFLPRAFLITVPVWGVAAGALVIAEGASIFLTRWNGPTLALVHLVTLGVLGNAVVGSLFQFLPAAAGIRPWCAVPCGRAAHGLLNTGTAALVAGFHGFHSPWLELGATLLAAAFAVGGVSLLGPLVRHGRMSITHAGIGFALLALLLTAGLGVAMAGALTGAWPGLAVAPWVDVHAAWGLVAGGLGLLAAVAQTVVPMFHGAAAMPPRVYAGWLLTCGGVLVAWSLQPSGRAGLIALGICAATWAGSTLGRLWRAGRIRRNPTLVHSWAAGCVCLLSTAVALASGLPAPVVGALALGLVLPLFVLPMLLEITAFLGWIGLQRAEPRRRRVPGIDALQPERAKTVVMVLHGAAGLTLVTAAAWPADVLARAAGALLVAAHGALALAIAGARRRERRFLAAGAA